MDEQQEVADTWFANTSEMLGTALNCEICLGGMKVVQLFFESDFLVNGLIGVGDSICYVLRNKFMYASCSGYVSSSVPAISQGLTGFLPPSTPANTSGVPVPTMAGTRLPTRSTISTK